MPDEPKDEGQENKKEQVIKSEPPVGDGKDNSIKEQPNTEQQKTPPKEPIEDYCKYRVPVEEPKRKRRKYKFWVTTFINTVIAIGALATAYFAGVSIKDNELSMEGNRVKDSVILVIMQRTADATKASSDAMKTNADATKENVEVNKRYVGVYRDAMEKQNRAYLILSNWTIVPNGNTFDYKIVPENVGKTPAKINKVEVSWHTSDEAHIIDDIRNNVPIMGAFTVQESDGTIGSGKNMEMSRTTSPQNF
jgi:hypothetical protein